MAAREPHSKATVLTFDKTETLTITAQLAAKSEPPLARALRAEVARSGQQFDGSKAVRNFPGKGSADFG